jgi:hypothetical protein
MLQVKHFSIFSHILTSWNDFWFLCYHTTTYKENLRGGAKFGKVYREREREREMAWYWRLLQTFEMHLNFFLESKQKCCGKKFRSSMYKKETKKVDLLTLIWLYTHLFAFIFPFAFWFSNDKFLSVFYALLPTVIKRDCYRLGRCTSNSLWHM